MSDLALNFKRSVKEQIEIPFPWVAFPQVENSVVCTKFPMGSKLYFSLWNVYFFQFNFPIDKFLEFEYM